MSVVATLPVRSMMKVKVVNDHVNINVCQNYQQIASFCPLYQGSDRADPIKSDWGECV